MLDIISMITFLFIFIGLPMILVIIGGNDKTEEEQKLEDKEQMEYLRQYREKKILEVGIWKKNYILGNKLELIV